MEPDFWRQRWEKRETGWHESQANQLLVSHFHELALRKGSRVFVPLCGKTVDIAWLLSRGCRVAGAELSQLAIEQLFMELGMQPDIAKVGEVEQWSANRIDVFVGDIFALSRHALGPVDAVYDRAALVALPDVVRDRYTAHLMQLTNKAPQLLICYDYDQQAMQGPPFSVNADEVHRHYDRIYDVTLLESKPVSGGLKGITPAHENLWRLRS
jgi:thiopurine S-methyltransferase